jgi:RHS repeat-associated protein
MLAQVTANYSGVTLAFTAGDANGNVTEYVAEDGSVLAHREYSTFGETTAFTGTEANMFLHWWSTKPWCSATGLGEYVYRKYHPLFGRWLSRDPAGEEEGENLYGFCGNDGNNNYDFTGLSWTVTRRMAGPGSRTLTSQGDITALAEWTSSETPDFDLLAENIGMDVDEVLQWARKDATGTRFASRIDLEDSCNFYIPNRILLIAHDSEHFRYRPKRYFSRRLNQWGERMADYYSSLRGYAQLHYRYSYPQGGPTDGDRQINPMHILWPTAGFVVTAHGKKGLLPEQRVEKGASVLYGDSGDEYQLTPLNFMGPRCYRFSFVYVASCFAGSLPWKDLASGKGDLFVSPSWRAEAELFLPKNPNPPRW